MGEGHTLEGRGYFSEDFDITLGDIRLGIWTRDRQLLSMKKKTCYPIPKPMYSSLLNEGIFLSILFIEQVVLLENMCFVSGFMHQALLNTLEFTLYLEVY